MSGYFTMSQILHSYIFWLLYEGGLLSTENNYFGVPTIQGVHDLDFNAMINVKICSSGAYDIYLRVFHYCLLKFIWVKIYWNVQSIRLVLRIYLVQIIFVLCWKTRWLISLQNQILVFTVEKWKTSKCYMKVVF